MQRAVTGGLRVRRGVTTHIFEPSMELPSSEYAQKSDTFGASTRPHSPEEAAGACERASGWHTGIEAIRSNQKQSEAIRSN